LETLADRVGCLTSKRGNQERWRQMKHLRVVLTLLLFLD
jgi:hypothetical protein